VIEQKTNMSHWLTATMNANIQITRQTGTIVQIYQMIPFVGYLCVYE
jgi:hypothetical protein